MSDSGFYIGGDHVPPTLREDTSTFSSRLLSSVGKPVCPNEGDWTDAAAAWRAAQDQLIEDDLWLAEQLRTAAGVDLFTGGEVVQFRPCAPEGSPLMVVRPELRREVVFQTVRAEVWHPDKLRLEHYLGYEHARTGRSPLLGTIKVPRCPITDTPAAKAQLNDCVRCLRDSAKEHGWDLVFHNVELGELRVGGTCHPNKHLIFIALREDAAGWHKLQEGLAATLALHATRSRCQPLGIYISPGSELGRNWDTPRELANYVFAPRFEGLRNLSPDGLVALYEAWSSIRHYAFAGDLFKAVARNYVPHKDGEAAPLVGYKDAWLRRIDGQLRLQKRQQKKEAVEPQGLPVRPRLLALDSDRMAPVYCHTAWPDAKGKVRIPGMRELFSAPGLVRDVRKSLLLMIERNPDFKPRVLLSHGEFFLGLEQFTRFDDSVSEVNLIETESAASLRGVFNAHVIKYLSIREPALGREVSWVSAAPLVPSADEIASAGAWLASQELAGIAEEKTRLEGELTSMQAELARGVLLQEELSAARAVLNAIPFDAASAPARVEAKRAAELARLQMNAWEQFTKPGALSRLETAKARLAAGVEAAPADFWREWVDRAERLVVARRDELDRCLRAFAATAPGAPEARSITARDLRFSDELRWWEAVYVAAADGLEKATAEATRLEEEKAEAIKAAAAAKERANLMEKARTLSWLAGLRAAGSLSEKLAFARNAANWQPPEGFEVKAAA